MHLYQHILRLLNKYNVCQCYQCKKELFQSCVMRNVLVSIFKSNKVEAKGRNKSWKLIGQIIWLSKYRNNLNTKPVLFVIYIHLAITVE